MRPTEILREEHQVILSVLSCLETALADCQAQGKADSESFPRFVFFFRKFADHWHHGKEEDLLFPALERAGMPATPGPLAVMRYEHDQGRALVAAMAEHVEGAMQGEATHLYGLIQAGESFLELLRNHIAKEDRVLFGMADRLLSAEQTRALLEAYARRDQEDSDPGLGDEGRKVAQALVDRWLGERV